MPEINYVFPPFSFIPQVLQHVQQCKAKAVLIVPNWPSQSWWVQLEKMTVERIGFTELPVFERVVDGQWQPVTKSSFAAQIVAVDGARM